MQTKEINEEQAKRVCKQALNVLEIVKMVRKGAEANAIVQEVGCNYSVAKYYIKLLTNEKN